MPVFPNLGQAVLLVLGTLAMQAGAGAGIAGMAMVFSGGLAAGTGVLLNPWTLAAMNCLAVGAMLRLGLRATREPAAAFFAVRPFSRGLVPPSA
ncbi:MAG: hypothetical protein ACOZE5_10770 [Verrucomicrobiota bacterium]